MRRGIRASQTSSAERGEFGRTSARSKRQRAQFATHGQQTFAGDERDGFIEGRMMPPEVGELFGRQQSDVCVGKPLAQALQRGRGHHGVAEPIDAAHQDAARMEDRGWKMAGCGTVFHFLYSILHCRLFDGIGFRAGDWWSGTSIFSFPGFPPVVHPEPVGRVAANGGFEGAVHVAHDGGGGRGAGRFRAWEFPAPASMRQRARPTR